MRSMLFDKQAEGIREMLKEFDDLFSPGYRCTMRLLTMQPAITAWGLRLISRLVRLFKIRRKLTRKPT